MRRTQRILSALLIVPFLVLAGALNSQAMAAEGDLYWSADPQETGVHPRSAAPPWGACGINSDEKKHVRTFAGSDRRVWVLYCGGPKYSSSPTWGYRHILWRHRGDFERMAAGTNQNWRDVADIAMDAIAKDPDKWGDAGGDKHCRSRVIYLYNRNTGQLVRTQIVVQFSTYEGGKSSRIITAYPRGYQC